MTVLAIFIGTVLTASAFAASEKLLHSFQSNFKDGFYPEDGLIFDDSGNLYGTTFYGGTDGGGTVFELMPKAGGGWKEKVLHNFNDNRRGRALSLRWPGLRFPRQPLRHDSIGRRL